MPRISITTRDGAAHDFVAETGTSLMESTRLAGFDDIQAICGGCASCATCHVYIDRSPTGAEIPEMSEDEDDLLDGLFYRKPNSRLSCQILVTASLDGLAITIPPED